MIYIIKQISSISFNEDNGEVYYDCTKTYESKLWKEGKGAILKPNNYMNKMYRTNKLFEIIKNKRDLLNTYILTEYIYKDTNIIYYIDENINRIATIKDISTIIDLCEKRTKEYLNRMIDLGIIAEISTIIKNKKYKSYIFNPLYVNSCRYINNTTYLLFKNYLDKYFPDWIKNNYIEISRKESL